MADGPARILVCTHHLYAWRGSELVAIELVEGLQASGAEVHILCQHFEPDFIQEAFGAGIMITERPEDLDPYAYDLIYSQHQMARHLIPALLAGLKDHACGPVMVHNHLSPFEPYEAPGPYFERHMSDLVWANSPETKARLHMLAPWLTVDVVPNPAPDTFAADPKPPTPKTAPPLRRILAVSNHPPEDLRDALDLLEAQRLQVTRLGQGQDMRRVLPEDLHSHDAIVTIGKSVQYALRARVPVFCFDHFGGPGWLTQDTFDAALETNFSGRPQSDAEPFAQRTAAQLASDIQTGFAQAWAFAQGRTPVADAIFSWGHYIKVLRALAQAPPSAARKARWHALRTDPERRSELALDYEQARLLAQLYNRRRALALNARSKRQEQAATIKTLRAQINRLKAAKAKAPP